MESVFTQTMLVIAAFMVVLGLGLLLAAYYMGRQARRALTLMDELLRLAQKHEDDPLLFIPGTLRVLEQAGMGYGRIELRWFGERTQFEAGGRAVMDEADCLVRTIGQVEIEARLMMCPRRGLKGEQGVLYAMIQQLWLRLLCSQVSGRLAQLHLSEQRLRRYELFYKHDLKNLAQFMGLLSAQLRHDVSEQKARALVRRLQKVLPALERRAGRILAHLENKQQGGWQGVEVVSLAERLRLVAYELELEVDIEGDVRLAVVESAMTQGLQNVLENFRHHQHDRRVKVMIRETDGGVEMTLTGRGMTGGLDARRRARMFEPFWSNSESGMGLGLYIARQSVQQACGGTLEAVVLDEDTGQWGFRIRCPKVPADQ